MKYSKLFAESSPEEASRTTLSGSVGLSGSGLYLLGLLLDFSINCHVL